MLWIWVSVICLSALVEVFSWDMTSIWVTCGAIVALIIYAFVPEVIIAQIIPFIVVTALLIIFIRPIVKKTIDKRTVKTNTSSLVGQQYKLLSDIKTDNLGTIKVNDVIWSVTTNDDEEIASGTMVEICEIKGNKFIVKKATKTENAEDVSAEPKEKSTKNKKGE